jgi:hypothetical protein|tara:strand:- start:1268 stop:1660 length:393 start_codon:yes stop_codon:yes gene_type:complete
MIGFKDFLSVLSEASSPSEGESLPISEVLSFQGRRKKSIALRRRKQQIQRQRKIALKRPASLDRLKRRGRKSARDVLTKRYYGGKTRRDMSISQKQRVEKRLDKAKRVTGIISKRLLPSKRKLDVQRRRG